jgi:hypothetical protein
MDGQRAQAVKKQFDDTGQNPYVNPGPTYYKSRRPAHSVDPSTGQKPLRLSRNHRPAPPPQPTRWSPAPSSPACRRCCPTHTRRCRPPPTAAMTPVAAAGRGGACAPPCWPPRRWCWSSSRSSRAAGWIGLRPARWRGRLPPCRRRRWRSRGAGARTSACRRRRRGPTPPTAGSRGATPCCSGNAPGSISSPTCTT